jgi:hypothetical protein
LVLPVDSPLWVETDGVIEWVRDFIRTENIEPPAPPAIKLSDIDTASASAEAAASSTRKRKPESATEHMDADTVTEMFLGMFFTAVEMAAT